VRVVPAALEVPPPRDERELLCRALDLEGWSLAAIATEVGAPVPASGVRAKGKVGELVERALGARAGTASVPDFTHLGIELKTIPVDDAGRVQESTFVCSVSLHDADRAEWGTSAARAKLACVLWVPIVVPRDGSPRRVGRSTLWRPTADQEAVLRADFEDLMGTIGVGGIEGVTAHAGEALQLRPKAKTGRVRTLAFGAEGERIATVPRGFYLRARFTARILSG
jgi:DNA mismatch repair protein MutH